MTSARTQNLYAYSGNNPVNMVDPTGHFAITAAILLIAVIGTAIATSPDLEMDLWDLSNDLSCGNYGWAAFDAAMIILPAVPASTVKPVINTIAETTKPWWDDVGKFFSKTWDDIGEGFKKSNDVIDTVDDTIKKSTDFIVTEGGEAIPVPKGATGPNSTRNGKGFVFDGGSDGANGQVSGVRVMDPVEPVGKSPGYPNGYVVYMNALGQSVDYITGRTVSRRFSHIPIRMPK